MRIQMRMKMTDEDADADKMTDEDADAGEDER